jgi:tetratricopeptide (TPR) repeat protein
MSKVEPSPVRSRNLVGSIRLLMALVVVVGLSLFVIRSLTRPDAETLSKRAQNEFMAQQYDLAAADLEQVLQIRPPTPFDLMLKAQILMLKGENDQALEILNRIPDDHAMGPQARLQAGQLELRRNRFVPAEQFFLQALKLNPKLERARRELIYIYGMQLRRAELSASFRALTEVAPLTYSEVFLWCLSRGLSWEAVEIVETLKKCIEADPNDRWARLGMAEGLRELGRFDEAEAAIQPLPESDPVARASRVLIALDRGDVQTADTLLETGPNDDVELALLRGRFALARGDGPEAVRQFQIAYNLAPTLREAVLGLSQALKNTGDLKAAAPLAVESRKHERLATLIQKAAVESNRSDRALMRDLGAACADLNRLEEARAWYNLAVSEDPFDNEAQEGLARVKERIKARR